VRFERDGYVRALAQDRKEASVPDGTEVPSGPPELQLPPEGGATVKAIRIREPAGISGLVYEEVPDARPGLDDVLVKVVACGITHNELD
jgi:hypothetical protein